MNEPPPNRRPFPWTIALLCAVVVILGSFGLVAFLKPILGVRDLAHRGMDAGISLITNAPAIAERFKTGTITHTFRESVPSIRSNNGDVLEVAVSEAEEIFTRSDELRVGWDWLYLGTTVAEIRVPATFRYHIRLSENWNLVARDQVCIVRAPRIRPSFPPAIHTDRMEKCAASGWARFDKGSQLEELERGLTLALAERAMDGAHLALVREASRQSVAAFVRNWLLKEDHWRTDRFTSIVVVFPDEVAPGEEEKLSSTRPTLRLDPH